VFDVQGRANIRTVAWVVTLLLGVILYLLYPALLPYLLAGAMVLMHLGGHGGHGHGTCQPDTDPDRTDQPKERRPHQH
jgi:hypothetical protein